MRAVFIIKSPREIHWWYIDGKLTFGWRARVTLSDIDYGWWRTTRVCWSRVNFRARIKMLSGQAEGDTRLDCSAATWPRNSRANTGTIPRFTVTAGTVSGQRAARVCNQRTHFNAVRTRRRRRIRFRDFWTLNVKFSTLINPLDRIMS